MRLGIIKVQLGILQLCLHVPQLLLGLRCLASGMAQLNLHLIQVSLHLLFDSQGIIPAPDLRVQSALHGVNHPLAVPLDLLHFLIFFCQLPVHLTLDLVELQLDAEDLGLFMFQGSLSLLQEQSESQTSQSPPASWPSPAHGCSCQSHRSVQSDLRSPAAGSCFHASWSPADPEPLHMSSSS